MTDIKKKALTPSGLIILSLIVLTLSVYADVRHFDFVDIDDDGYVYQNQNVKNGLTWDNVILAFTTFEVHNWHPLTILSHMSDVEFFGLDPGWHHLTNVFFHITNAILLFVVFSKMTNAVFRSAFIAALFALHPMHVESVAWVSERKDVLSVFFWFLTMLSYVYYAQRPSVRKYLLLLLSFTLGLLSKPMMVTLPFVLLLMDYWPLRRLKLNPAQQTGDEGLDRLNNLQIKPTSLITLIYEKLPLVVLSLVSIALTYYAQSTEVHNNIPIRFHIEKVLVSYFTYIKKMFIPVNMAFVYVKDTQTWPMYENVYSALTIILVSLMAIMAVRRAPFFFCGWLWFIATLVPAIGIVSVGLISYTADRYTYIPYTGLFLIIAMIIPSSVLTSRRVRILIATGALFIVVACAVLARKQVQYWQNNETLYRHALEVTDENSLKYQLYCISLLKSGRYDEALDACKKALRIKPFDEIAYTIIGDIYFTRNDLDKAYDNYKKSIRIRPNTREHYAYDGMGVVLLNKGMAAQSIYYFNKALEIRPDFEEAAQNLARAKELFDNQNPSSVSPSMIPTK
ncbi:MAG: glycosyltransferase family 39 protein [Nitrospirae bacterium]|nr:glycosyltransferase family 39 protein [Nitrospirota bacterium]MBF0591296.1 glycosyltransferase family 39 protein [Nitrospirota bacterium]